MSDKVYHFGVVAAFDEATCTWTFEAMPVNGDESPFMEMQEVYNYDTYEWEDAFMDAQPAEDYVVERANYVLLIEAIEIAQKRLDEGADHRAA